VKPGALKWKPIGALMVDLKNLNEVKKLKADCHTVFDSPQGKDVMKFMQEIGGWFPSVFDSMETNDIIARDATRRLLGTIRTIMDLAPEQIVALANKGEGNG
jgi:hypothetical protein